MQISLFGLTLFSENKGCEALAYAFLDLLSEIAMRKRKKIDIVVNMTSDIETIPIVSLQKKWENLNISFQRINIKCKKNRNSFIKQLKKSSLCFDFTEGDSFTDMYGIKRFIYRALVKSFAIKKNKRYILGPQTYGPYKRLFSRNWAKWIINHSSKVYSRDEMSKDLISSMTKKEVFVTTDVAMALKPDVQNLIESKKIKVGINVSGLLWNGGYSQNNQFNLTVDYQKYIKKLVSYLCESGFYDIYLIPHVITIDDYDNVENDLKVCEVINKLFSECKVIYDFETPSKIKGVISQMDIFTGARMHSTIAAFSTNVPVIPFSYSKKFEGLFCAVNYSYLIDGKKLTTQEAFEKTKEYILQYKKLKEDENASLKIVNEKINEFKCEIEKLIMGE